MSTTNPPSPLVATCHCKDFRLTFAAKIEDLTRCNCTFCTKRGTLWAYGTPADLTIEKSGTDVVYVCGDSPNRHHHCGRCGCTLYSETPDWSTGIANFDKPRIGLNANLVDDVIAATHYPIVELDGRNMW